MEKVQVTCDLCGRKFPKNRTAVNEHNFCSREHFYHWNAGRMADYNRTGNPMNKPGGVLASRIRRGEKLRGGGDGKTYHAISKMCSRMANWREIQLLQILQQLPLTARYIKSTITTST